MKKLVNIIQRNPLKRNFREIFCTSNHNSGIMKMEKFVDTII
jgi:hypothetical protein